MKGQKTSRFQYNPELAELCQSIAGGALMSYIVWRCIWTGNNVLIEKMNQLEESIGVDGSQIKDGLKKVNKHIIVEEFHDSNQTIRFTLYKGIVMQHMNREFEKMIGRINVKTMRMVGGASVMPFGDAFRDKWIEWLVYRKKIGKPYKSPESLKKLFTQIEKFDEEYICELIDFAIANAHQGLIFKDTYEKYIASKAKNATRKNRNSAKKSGVGGVNEDGF